MKKNKMVSIRNGIEIKVCEKQDPLFHYIDIYALTDERPCDNYWWFLNAEKNAKSFQGQLILCAFPNGKIGDGHNSTLLIDKFGNETRSFLGKNDERIVGYIDPDADIRMEKYRNESWVVVPAKISKCYCPELVLDLEKKGSKMVSVEIMSNDETMRMEGNIEVYPDWIGAGITILGDDITPAFEGAKTVNANLKLASLQERKEIIGIFEKELIRVSNCQLDQKNSENNLETAKKNELRSEKKEMKKNRQEFLDSFNLKFKTLGFTAYEFDDDGQAVICYKNNEAYSFTEFEKNDKAIEESDFKKLSLQAEVVVGEKTLLFNVDRLMAQLQGKDQIEKLKENNETLTQEITAKNQKIAELEKEMEEIKEKEMESKCEDEIEKHNEKYSEECQKITEEKKANFLEKIKASEFKSKEEMLTAFKALKADVLDEGQIKLNEKKKNVENQHTWGIAKLNSAYDEAEDYASSLMITEKQ